MSKLKSRTFSPGPSTTQTGVLNYKVLRPQKYKHVRLKIRKAKRRDDVIAHHRDSIRQEVDADNRVNFDAVHTLLKRYPRMTLKEAKRISEGV